MNNNYHLYDHALADANRNAVAVIEWIISNRELYEAARKAYETSDNALAAFLLVPESQSVRPSQLSEACEAAFDVFADNKQQAVEELIEVKGWTGRLNQLNDDIGAIDLLTWDEGRLQGVLGERYEFIETYAGCYVFNRAALRQFSEY